MLYFVATPIGNLSDISLRALEVLRKADAIFCEDTRHSQRLLQHYEIAKPLYSYHKFNEEEKIKQISALLEDGKELCLLCDAGTPTIADPGKRLIRHCVSKGFPYTALPGPCAMIQALSLCSFSTEPMQFLGFLPKKSQDLKQILLKAIVYQGTSLAYESPKRLISTLQSIKDFSAALKVAVARELTKKFEEVKEGPVEDLLEYYTKYPCKGEIVLLIEGTKMPHDSWEHLSEKEHVEEIMDLYKISLKEALKLVAELRYISKREVYQRFHIDS